MPKTPAEPANIMLEQLRAIRAEIAALQDNMNTGFRKVDAELADIKRDMRGMKLNTIAEVYKANLTVARFIDLERRVEALEQNAPS